MYCIHCGVELRKGTTRCPLCRTDYEKVMSSLEEETAYPQNTNHNAKKIRNAQMRYIGILLSVASVIPIVICLLIDYLDHASITWSKYVILSVAVFWVFFILPFFVTGKKMLILSTADAIASILYFFLISRFTESQSWAVVVCGSIALVWCIVFLPFMMPKSLVSICACILIDGIATMLFLATLGTLFGDQWLLPVALPITVGFCVIFLAAVLLFRRKVEISAILAKVLFSATALCVIINMTINRYLDKTPLVTWAVIIILICVPLGILTLLLGLNKKLRAFMHKHFYI